MDYFKSAWNSNDIGSKAVLKGKTYITLQPNIKSKAYGILVYGWGELTSDGLVSIALDTSQQDIGGVERFSGIYAGSTLLNNYSWQREGAKIKLKNGLEVILPSDVAPGQSNIFSILSEQNSKKPSKEYAPSISVKNQSAAVKLEGNLQASNWGAIDLIMTGNQSYLTGWSNNRSLEDDVYNGEITIALNKGSRWNVVSKLDKNVVVDNRSTLDSLELSGGVLNMAYLSRNNLDSWEEKTHRQVLVISGTGQNQGLTGTGGTISMDINLGDEGDEQNGGLNLDQIIVKGSTSGTHTLDVNFINDLAGVTNEKLHSENWLIQQAGGIMTLTGPNKEQAFTGNGMMSMWKAGFLPDGTSKNELDNKAYLESMSNTSSGKGDWYLIRVDKPKDPEPENPDPDNPDKPDPDPKPPVPPEADQQITVGISASQALAFASEIEDLRTRLGEVRYGAQDGGWVRLTAEKDHADGWNGSAFEQKTEAIHMGFDHLVSRSEDAAWLVGGAFRYGKSDQKGFNAADGAEGDLYQYSGKLYATWMQDNGSYLDFVLQAGRYKQELTGIANDASTKWTASYRTSGFGASIEAGHMFTLFKDENADDRLWYSHWFLEPQLQLSYFMSKGADYATTTGLRVDQGNADFLTGRAGLVLGKKWNYSSLDELDKRYFQLALMGGVKHEFLGDQDITFTGVDGVRKNLSATDFGGTRVYYGIMTDWQISDALRFYGQFNREESSKFTREYAFHAGLKYQF